MKEVKQNEVKQCSYNPETGELRVKPGGIYSMEFKDGMDDALWQSSIDWFRKTAHQTGTTFVLHSPDRPRVMVSHDEKLEVAFGKIKS